MNCLTGVSRGFCENKPDPKGLIGAGQQLSGDSERTGSTMGLCWAFENISMLVALWTPW